MKRREREHWLQFVICRIHILIKNKWRRSVKRWLCAHTRIRFCIRCTTCFCRDRKIVAIFSFGFQLCDQNNNTNSNSKKLKPLDNICSMKCYNFTVGESKCCEKPADLAIKFRFFCSFKHSTFKKEKKVNEKERSAVEIDVQHIFCTFYSNIRLLTSSLIVCFFYFLIIFRVRTVSNSYISISMETMQWFGAISSFVINFFFFLPSHQFEIRAKLIWWYFEVHLHFASNESVFDNWMCWKIDSKFEQQWKLSFWIPNKSPNKCVEFNIHQLRTHFFICVCVLLVNVLSNFSHTNNGQHGSLQQLPFKLNKKPNKKKPKRKYVAKSMPFMEICVCLFFWAPCKRDNWFCCNIWENRGRPSLKFQCTHCGCWFCLSKLNVI